MGIHRYLAQTERTYSYRIKSVLPLKDNDDALGRVEKAILKYLPVKMAEPRKLMFQATPQDFPFIENAEIHVLDIELSLPASLRVLTAEIAKSLGVNEKFLVVRGDNDPMENESQASTAKSEMDEESGDKQAALLDMPNFEEAAETEIKGEDLYGDAYNRRLMGYLKKIEAEKKPEIVDSANSPFDWLKMPKSDVAADEGPSLGSEDGAVAGKAEDMISQYGNLDDDRKTYTRAYQRKGGTYVKTKNADAVRK
jgi:hypothetical protein